MHPDYGQLASRIVIANLQKQTSDSFSEVIAKLYANVHPTTKAHCPLVSEATYQAVMRNAAQLDAALDYERDFLFDAAGFSHLESVYLFKIQGQTVERPQHMWMRVALVLCHNNIDAAIQTYDLLSKHYFLPSHATLLHAGTGQSVSPSVATLTVRQDAIRGIYDQLLLWARLLSGAADVTLHAQSVRAKGSYLSKTRSVANGLVPMLEVFDAATMHLARDGQRATVRLEPWHADLMDVLAMQRRNGSYGSHVQHALSFALWIPDLFMRRVKENQMWSLFCPAETQGLADVWGDAFDALYTTYEREGRARRTVSAQSVWAAILETQMETGGPSMSFKDRYYTSLQPFLNISPATTCTSHDAFMGSPMASIVLPRYITSQGFDFQQLHHVTKAVVRYLSSLSTLDTLPNQPRKDTSQALSLSVHGLADTFLSLRYPFDSDEAKVLNRQIFDTLYHAALEASCELAQEDESKRGVQGCERHESNAAWDSILDCLGSLSQWDWHKLIEQLKRQGAGHTFLIALTPAATTAATLCVSEGCGPRASYLQTFKQHSHTQTVIHPRLVQDLHEAGCWNAETERLIIRHHGSVQHVPGVPDTLKRLYRTAWEYPQRTLIDLAIDRIPYVDQMESINIFMREPSFAKLTSMHFYGWDRGLKTTLTHLHRSG